MDFKVEEMNHIATVCAELALYRVMVAIDPILDYYKNEYELLEVEAQLWRLLRAIQDSEILDGRKLR